MRDRPLISFYGDDLTGSTDAMEALTLAGVATVLFLDPADAGLRARFAGCQAYGLAGTSRSESPEWMDRELPRALEWLRGLDAGVCHYKVCSTFDSSPSTGSIGRAIEIAQRVFCQDVVPVIVGVPQLRRFTFFGQLFAAFREQVYRIDRHPVMARHPVTPMEDADLCRHLGRQTAQPVGLVDWRTLLDAGAAASVDAALRGDGSPRAVLLDVFDSATQEAAAQALLRRAAEVDSLFVVGSSSVEYGLVPGWRATSAIRAVPAGPAPGAVDRIAVVSGSCSPTTARQIEWARQHGFAAIAVDARRMASAGQGQAEEDRAFDSALAQLAQGQSVIAYTALGPDSVVPAAAEASGEGAPAHALGRRLGRLLRRLVEAGGLRRAVIAGGDTSSHGLRELSVQALTVARAMPQTPGSPLCRAHSDQPAVDGLEIALKGGQIGGDDYFEVIRRGGAPLADT